MGVFIGEAAGWGSNLILLLAYLIGGPPVIEPDFQKKTGKSLENVSIAVRCVPAEGVKLDDKSICDRIAKWLAIRLTQKNLRVADSDAVAGWVKRHAEERGVIGLAAAVEADFVIVVEVNEFTLHHAEKKQDFQGLFQGSISVHEIAKNSKGKRVAARAIYNCDRTGRYPIEAPLPGNMHTEKDFEKKFVLEVSGDLQAIFCPRYADED